jgi:hypothetical protein
MECAPAICPPPPSLTSHPVCWQGRHPVAQLHVPDDNAYQANDTALSSSSCLHIITGPTMAGKSTYLKQVSSGGIRGMQMGAGVRYLRHLPHHTPLPLTCLLVALWSHCAS